MTTEPDRSVFRQWLAVAALIAAMTALRVTYAGVIDLRTDEAYYWTWSKENVLCFLDHPPMIAWFIRLGTAIFGDTNIGVRFAGIVAMLVTQLLLADIVRRVTHDARAVALALLMPEAALYYGLLMAKVSPDVALIPFATAMLWALIRLNESGDARWWLAAGAFAGLALLSKFTAVMLLPAVVAFMLVPDWRWRWLVSPYPWLAALIAVVLFSPVLIWNAGHDWASFHFQLVRATATHEISLRTVGDYVGLQFGLVGFVLLPVVLSGVTLTAWRGYRRGDAVAILLSTAVIVPSGYFFWKSLTLRVGDTWPMFIWPAGFSAAAINIAMLPREGFPAWMIRSTIGWAKAAIVSGIGFVVLVFLYYVVSPLNLIGSADPIGGEAGYQRVVERAQAELQNTGASWIATTDYRTYAMLRWFFGDRVPVIQVNERARYLGFRDPGISLIKGRTGLYVGREPDNSSPLWSSTTAVRAPLERVDRIWRGIVMDTYALEKLTGWTPELLPAADSPLYRARTLAGLVSKPRGERGTVFAVSLQYSFLAVALAQEIFGEIGERGSWQGGERQRAGEVDGGEPEPRGQQAVEDAFAEPLRQFGGNAMAEHLLDQAVARRHAAGDGDMGNDMTHQGDHAERARPSAVQPRQLPDQAQRGREHEQHIDQSARADRGDDRDALRGGRDQAARLLIERRHQFAFGQPDQVGAIDDVAGMALQRGAGRRQMRVLMREFYQFLHDVPALPAIVAQQYRGGAQMQFFDRRQADKPGRFADDDNGKRQRGGASKGQSEET
jgi:Dolichyl-phosphate-mannose-protein mannosyltransferase